MSLSQSIAKRMVLNGFSFFSPRFNSLIFLPDNRIASIALSTLCGLFLSIERYVSGSLSLNSSKKTPIPFFSRSKFSSFFSKTSLGIGSNPSIKASTNILEPPTSTTNFFVSNKRCKRMVASWAKLAAVKSC